MSTIDASPTDSYKYVFEIKVRIKNTWPTGSFDAAGTGIPSFVTSALPTLAENLIPALLQIIYYAGDVIDNKKINAKAGLQLLQKAMGSMLLPHGALLSLGAGWFAPEGGPFTSASVNALILRGELRFMLFHDVSWCFMVFHGVSWCFMNERNVMWLFEDCSSLYM